MNITTKDQMAAAVTIVARLHPTSTGGRFAISVLIPPSIEDGVRHVLPLSARRLITRDTLDDAREVMDAIFRAVGGFGQHQWSSHILPRKYLYRICMHTNAQVSVEELSENQMPSA